MDDRGRRADEFIQALKAVWTTDPVVFDGHFYRIPPSVVEPKPLQKPHPPIYLGAFAAGALGRVARLADGWNAAVVPAQAVDDMMRQIRHQAREAGGDPERLELVFRANMHLTDASLDQGRGIFEGSAEQIEEDIRSLYEIGASEIFFDPIYTPDADTEEGFMGHLERIPEMVARATRSLIAVA
jgi:alkanesulfonate monooxygenase SsuD/methylene tetrahydromethanopterin reductase-like flavin-dependent oxidoreductase (luciferase family)